MYIGSCTYDYIITGAIEIKAFQIDICMYRANKILTETEGFNLESRAQQPYTF